MLTGESVPQMKEPIEIITEKRNFDIDSDGRLHMLYGGTKVLQHSSPLKTTTGLRGLF
jgi:cation-transporting ATPase 13A1